MFTELVVSYKIKETEVVKVNNVKNARINAGLSQKELALTMNVSIPTVSDWESGKKFPKGENLIKLAQILRTTTDYLLGVEDAQKEKLPAQSEELSEKDKRLIDWFRSLPPEKQKAILIAQDGPEDASD